MKLNLCCDDDAIDGFINIDIRKTKLLESIGLIVEKIQNDGDSNILCFARKRC
jgi:hypothetical protein